MNRLYLDMDGVVADFDEYASRILGPMPPHQGIYPNDQWEQISANPRLYRDLLKTPYADELVAECIDLAIFRDYELLFLTAVPKGNDVKWAFYDKVLWAKTYFPEIPVHFGPYSIDKWRHCNPGDILIDDRISNIDEWRAAGGIAIHHTAIDTTLFELSKLY